MAEGYFITGTDTGVGKTWATIALMRYFRNQGHSVVGMKPVAAGCEWRDGRLQNEDAMLIRENASLLLDYELINPYAYEAPVSPHLAGKDNPADFGRLATAFETVQAKADIVVVEGAGGWYSPLNESRNNADLAGLFGLPVIMVVAIRLGCINHAHLTLQAIRQSGLPLNGWLAVCTDPAMAYRDENIETLKSLLDTPLLGILPYSASADFDDFAKRLKVI